MILSRGSESDKSVVIIGDKKKSRWNSIKVNIYQNVKEFCKNTTLHGLNYMANKDLYLMERKFFNSKLGIIWSQSFPALTICNMNKAYKAKIQNFTTDSVEYAIIQMLCKRKVNVTVADTIQDWSSLNQFISDISQPCEKMLVSCRFGGMAYDCLRIFHPIVTDEGHCCAFNMVHPKFLYTEGTQSLIKEIYSNHSDMDEAIAWNPEFGYPEKMSKHFYPRTAAGTGESLGLTIVLDAEVDQYNCSSTNSVGFKMTMHNPNERPNVREVGLLLAAGYETKARVRMEKLEADKKLHTVHLKHRQCEFQDEHELTYFATYTQSNCEAECIAETLMRHCGCLPHYMPKRYDNETVCSIYDSGCVERIRLHSMNNDDDDNERECDEVCLPSCYALKFYAEFFSTPLEHGDFWSNNPSLQGMSEEYVERNIAIMTMYYKDNSFHSNKQTEFFGMTDVLSNIGGLIGLFFGFSFISLAEIIFYTFIRPCRRVRKQKAKSKSDKRPRRFNVIGRHSPRAYRFRRNYLSPFTVLPMERKISQTFNPYPPPMTVNLIEISDLEATNICNSKFDWRKSSMA
ncbi:pickpocket protein 28-like [Musca domestica]|uniref:Pickpocket protein 28-like n=1 Tax=Musca domestica TaxID=7370 RepID=A0ABM3UWS0_MUSDO|nr:pickpocket protein 28-like [Musca domestica]